jgi:N-acetylglutamate synthase
MDASIRPYRGADYDEVIAIWTGAGLPLMPAGRDSRERIEAQTAAPNIVFLVAESEDGRLAGTVLASHDGRKGWINRLAVRPEFRRQGLGSRLVLEAQKHLAGMGLDVFSCLIEEGSEASMSLFRKLGYRHRPDIRYFVKKSAPGS